jgi:hypothetical protein
LDKDEYSLISLVLNNNNLLAICKNAQNTHTKINKIASEIIGQEVSGPIVFMLFDLSLIPINMSTSVFKSLVYAQLNYEQINVHKLLLLFEIFGKYINKDIGFLTYPG